MPQRPPCTSPGGHIVAVGTRHCRVCGLVLLIGPKEEPHKPPPEAYAVPSNPRTLRRLERLLCEQLWKCAYCQRPLALEDATQDHVVPRSRGGRGNFNLVAACKPCNSDKSDLAPWEWTDRWYQREGQSA